MSDLPDGPVDTVESVSVLGAKIMRGTWPDGQQGVLIGSAHPADPIDAHVYTKEAELPEVAGR